MTAAQEQIFWTFLNRVENSRTLEEVNDAAGFAATQWERLNERARDGQVHEPPVEAVL